MKKILAVYAAPLLLSGCMMLGVGGMGMTGSGDMHGQSRDVSMNGPIIIKESVVNGMQVTAEFPPYRLGDDLDYRVMLRDARDRTPISGATIAMLVTPDDGRLLVAGPGQAGAHAGHADTSTTPTRGEVRSLRVSPVVTDNGAYVFRLPVTTAGAYRLVVLVERVGGTTMDPPFALEQAVRLERPMDEQAGSGGHTTRTRLAPAALVGAGVMAVMMFVMLR